MTRWMEHVLSQALIWSLLGAYQLTEQFTFALGSGAISAMVILRACIETLDSRVQRFEL